MASSCRTLQSETSNMAKTLSVAQVRSASDAEIVSYLGGTGDRDRGLSRL